MRYTQSKVGEYPSMMVIGYLTMIAVALLGIVLLESGMQRVAGTGLILIFGIVYTLSPHEPDVPWKKHSYFVVQSFIICLLMSMRPTWGVFPILFFILSAQAMMIFPQKIGYIWVGLFTIFTGLVFFIFDDALEAFLTLLPFSAGYWFFAAFSRALTAAEESRKESQTLLGELQLAHHQLQNYASQVEELAVAEERNRFAREMHDTLGHHLTVAAVQLEGAQRLIPDEPNRAVQIITTVRDQIREALTELRGTVATLREPLQTDLSLVKALPRLTASFEEATNLKVDLILPEKEFSIPDSHRLTIYRATQEALTNVQRHAKAQQVWVTLACDDNYISLNVSDDGVGISEEIGLTSFGLRGLRERALHLGGEVLFENRPLGGTQLCLKLPLIK